MPTAIHRTIEAVWRIEAPRLIAALTRMVRDVGLAEDLAQDALVAALEQWPESGVPDKPGAWLMTAAKRRSIDHFRRSALLHRKHEELGRDFAVKEMDVPSFDAALEPGPGDDLLRLLFISCHPVLPPESRAALTLRLLGGRHRRDRTRLPASRTGHRTTHRPRKANLARQARSLRDPARR